MEINTVIFLIVDFIITSAVIRRKIETNRGNLVNQPQWKKVMINTEDVVFLAFLIYIWLMKPGDEEMKQKMVRIYTTAVGMGFALCIAAAFLRMMRDKREKTLDILYGFEEFRAIDGSHWSAAEAEYVKYVMIDLGKIMMVTWEVLCGALQLEGIKAHIPIGVDEATEIYIERFLIILCIIGFTFAAHNLYEMCFRREKVKRTDETDRILKKLMQKNIRV